MMSQLWKQTWNISQLQVELIAEGTKQQNTVYFLAERHTKQATIKC